MKVLFLGCHCDDIELGCGATIHHFKKKWDIYCLVLSKKGLHNKFPKLYKNCQKAMKELGVKNLEFANFKTGYFYETRQKIWEKLNEINLRIKPDLVFSQEKDDHQDHKVLWDETKRNFRKSSLIQYTVMRSSIGFIPNLFFELNKKDFKAKTKSLKNYKMYTNSKNYFTKLNIEASLRNSGIYIESEFSESFKIKKLILNEKHSNFNF
jgi:LmbE family N-acetylglucosaminyl deacetylase